MKYLLLSMCALASTFFATGCGQKTPDGLPDLQSVALTVVQDGKPLGEAMITLKAVDSSNTWTSGGTTLDDGVATLVTHGQYKGVPVGKYKVAVSKVVGEGTPPPPSPIDEESAKRYKEYKDSGATYEEFDVVDPKYGTIETTPLEIEVVKGKNELTVDVGEAVRNKVNTGRGVARIPL